MWISRALAELFTPMRMNKSGSFSVPAFSTAMVTGWVADGAYPGTNIVSNQLKMTTAGTGKTVSGACAFTSSFSLTVNAQLYKNGTPFGTVQSMTASGTFTFNHTGQTVAVNDTWDLRVGDPSGGASITVQASGTFLKVE